MNDIITIDKKSIVLAKDEGGNLTFTPQAKVEIEKILYVKKLIEEIYSQVQDKLTEEMNKQKIKKIVAGNIIVSKRFYGERYQIDDKESVDEKFTKVVEWVKPDAEAIEKYVEENTGELPEGISLKARSEKASISERSSESST